ncbi:hypothetical protein PHMEG_0007780 [Phytophthora megakarya]|uniref:Chorein N-terminal domain-containing protein n=1 Tax=Phytophthora megakarya TaxID=4795 RepID=A0A225WMF7_9STRA|nr:hypothetical protein PHMEG_0007780 [Phytophthora megakarya]
MFEKVVESVLEEYVSEWVEGLDSEKMKVALFAGKVEFRDLRMRGAALEKFQLPMKMKSGSVGKLSIKVPWKKLTSQAVQIKIEDVFLVVEPTDQDDAKKEDDDSYLLRTRWAKQQEVRMLELLETVKNDGSSSSVNLSEHEDGAAESDPTASWGYRKKILNTIMDNVSFEFSNIHIRYEDSKHLASSVPLALGLTIDSIVISTTNANGQAEFVDRAQARTAFVHRRLEMVQASVYGDHIEATGARKGPSASGSNIIHPFSTRINLARNHDERTASTIPKLRCSAEISAIRACLTPEQSTFLIGIADFVSAHEMYLKRLHFQRKRPTVAVRSNARLWWQYALHGVMELHPSPVTHKITETVSGGTSPRKKSVVSRRSNWKLFATLWFARKEYIHLHKNMLRAAKKKKLDMDSVMADRSRLNKLEDTLEVPTIVFFRLCAARELELEGHGNDSPRKLSQWKSKWSSGRTSSGSSSTTSTGLLDKMDIYLAVNERMHASSEARTSSFSEERNVEALLMALDLVVISFEVVLVEQYKVGDKSDTRDFLRFELNEFVVTVLQRTSSSTVSSRITSIQILDFRQTYESTPLEKKEPQALLSMIEKVSSTGQVATRKNPFVELNIESTENRFQLDCVFERFRYIHNLYATSKLRAYFIPRTAEVALPAPVKAKPSPPKLTRNSAALSAELLRKKSIESAFSIPEPTKARRNSASSRALHTRDIVFSVKLPEIDVFVHTTDESAEVEARLVGTHFQNGAAHNTFELSIECAETYFLEANTTPSEVGQEDTSDRESAGRKRSTLMQSTCLVFYGQKLKEGYLVPKWQTKCTAPPIQFSMSSKQYEQLLQASAEWQGPNQSREVENSKSTIKSALFVAEDERLNVCISIPQILIDFKGEGPVQEALSAASTESDELTGFELDIRDLSVMARFSSAAQAVAVDLSALSLVKCLERNLPDNKIGDSPLDNDTTQNTQVVTSSIPTPISTATDTVDPVYDLVTGYRSSKILELRGKTSVMIASSEPLMGEVNIEQAAVYWDHELLVALVQYHAKSLVDKKTNSASGTNDIHSQVARFALQVRVQRWYAFFMPKACWHEQLSFILRGTDLRFDISTLETEYISAKVDVLGETQLVSSRLHQLKCEEEVEGESSFRDVRVEESHVLLQLRTPAKVKLESAGFGSLPHHGGAVAFYRIEGDEVQVNYLHSYWSPFLNHITREITGFSRWTDLIRMPTGIHALNERLKLELDIAHVRLMLPTCEAEAKHKTPSDHFELDIRHISSASRAYPDDPTQEQIGIQVKSVQVLAVMAEPKRSGHVLADEEAQADVVEKDEAPERRYFLGEFNDVFIEHVAIPFVPPGKKIPKQTESDNAIPSIPDINDVLEEMDKMCSHAKVILSSRSNWLTSVINTALEEDDAAPTNSIQEENCSTASCITNLAINPYQVELLSRILDNNFAGLPPPSVCNFANADEVKVTDMAFELGDLSLDLLDPLDTSIDNVNSGQPSSGTVIGRIRLDRFQVAIDGFASLRSQVRASSSKGSLWKIDWDDDDADNDTRQKGEVRELCGSIFCSLDDEILKQGIDIVVDRRAPSPDTPIPPKEVRIHLDNCELLPVIVEFGQRLRYFASIESDVSEHVERINSSLDVSITTGFVYYLAAECVPNHVDDFGNEAEGSRSEDITLKMIASGCIVGRYHSDDTENSQTQVYGRNMSVKVSSQWPPKPGLSASPTTTSPESTDSPTKNGVSSCSNYERTVCDDFTIDVELVTAEDAEATMSVNLTHFHAVICTVDLFLFTQAKNVLGTDDDESGGNTETEKSGELESLQEGEGEDSSNPVEPQQRSLAPPEIEFREDSISMVQLLLEDISITLLRQSGPHLSPIARLYTFRAMCKVTYEVGERIDGVVPTLTEVAVEFPDESLNEPNADDGVSIWGFNTALGSWEPIVEPWMFDLKGSLTRDETREVTANLDFTGKEGHPLNQELMVAP